MKYGVVLLLSLWVFACSQPAEAPNAVAAPNAPTKPTDSELTLYMRHLEKEAHQWRDSVLSGSAVAINPQMIDSMYTATPTDGKIGDSLLFNELGGLFNAEVQGLTNASTADLTKHYNLMVTACVNCHRNFCPGPIKRIERLRIN